MAADPGEKEIVRIHVTLPNAKELAAMETDRWTALLMAKSRCHNEIVALLRPLYKTKTDNPDKELAC